MKPALARTFVLLALSGLAAAVVAAPSSATVAAEMVAIDLPHAAAKKKSIGKKPTRPKKVRAGAGKK